MMMRTRNHLTCSFIALALLCLVGAACGGQANDPGPAEQAPPDARDASFSSSGKADWAVPEEDSPEADAVLRVVNTADFTTLDKPAPEGVGLHHIPAQNIIEHRNGEDGQLGTEDDARFESLADLDAVSYVGLHALTLLVDYARAHDMIASGPRPQLQASGRRVLTRIRFLRALDDTPAGLMLSNTEYHYGDETTVGAAWRFLDPETLEPISDTGTATRPHQTTPRYKIGGPFIGDDKMYFAFNASTGGSQAMDSCELVVVNLDSPMQPRSYRYPGLSRHYGCRLRRGTAAGPGPAFVVQGHSVYYTNFSSSPTDGRVSLADSTAYSSRFDVEWSPPLNRYVILSAKRNEDDKFDLYTRLAEPTRNFGEADTEPVLIPGAQSMYPFVMTWNGEGFDLFGFRNKAVYRMPLNAAGEPVGQFRRVLRNVRILGDIVWDGTYYVIANINADSRHFELHLLDRNGEKLSSVELSDEPVIRVQVAPVDGGYAVAWKDPNDMTNLRRVDLID